MRSDAGPVDSAGMELNCRTPSSRCRELFFVGGGAPCCNWAQEPSNTDTYACIHRSRKAQMHRLSLSLSHTHTPPLFSTRCDSAANAFSKKNPRSNRNDLYQAKVKEKTVMLFRQGMILKIKTISKREAFLAFSFS